MTACAPCPIAGITMRKTILSSAGPGHNKVNSKILKLKVHLKSVRDLDMELLAIITIPTTHHHSENFSELNNF